MNLHNSMDSTIIFKKYGIIQLVLHVAHNNDIEKTITGWNHGGHNGRND